MFRVIDFWLGYGGGRAEARCGPLPVRTGRAPTARIFPRHTSFSRSCARISTANTRTACCLRRQTSGRRTPPPISGGRRLPDGIPFPPHAPHVHGGADGGLLPDHQHPASRPPPFPQACQWALFLRNHDELTLEMVTDEERDYMYRVYARDTAGPHQPGIRRRLAPLMGNDRRKIELMNVLLFCPAGDPDNLLWRRDRHGGQLLPGRPQRRAGPRCSGAPTEMPAFPPPTRRVLYLPVIIDPEYHYQASTSRIRCEIRHRFCGGCRSDDRPAQAVQGLRLGKTGIRSAGQPESPRLHRDSTRNRSSW